MKTIKHYYDKAIKADWESEFYDLRCSFDDCDRQVLRYLMNEWGPDFEIPEWQDFNDDPEGTVKKARQIKEKFLQSRRALMNKYVPVDSSLIEKFSKALRRLLDC